MSFESGSELASKPSKRFSPEDVLPPVEPPNVAFVRQLVLIPLLIVSLIVGAWLLFNWLASGSADPDEMLREIRRNRESGWQQAVTLASILDNPDARYTKLRRDPAFANKLGEILQEQRKEAFNNRKQDDQRLKLCYFLCHALGGMETEAAFGPLLEAATSERTPLEIDIRLGALEGISLLAHRLGPEALRENEAVTKVLLECSRASDENSLPAEDQGVDYKPHGEVRGAAAFAMGVIGGSQALDRLAAMLEDPYPSARYNAALGLARNGDARAVPALVEMLDPHNDLVAKDEKREGERDKRRIAVLQNAMEGTLQLAPKVSRDVLMPVEKMLEQATQDGFVNVVSGSARQALHVRATEVLSKLRQGNS